MSEQLYWLKLPDKFPVPENLILLPFRKVARINKFSFIDTIEVPPGIGKLFFLNGNTAILVDSFSGQKAFFVASLFYASGTKRIYFVGTTGAIGDFKPGTVVVPAKVTSSFDFFNFKRFQEVKLNTVLPSFLSEYEEGNVVTVFSPIEENPEFIKKISKSEFYFLEMELFPLVVASKLYGKEIKAVLLVSDIFIGGKWRPFFNDPEFKRSKEDFFDKLVNFLS